MSAFFGWDVDSETQRNCLDIVQRAMERSMRGLNAVLGAGQKIKASHGKARVNARPRSRQHVTAAQEREIMRLRELSVPRREVARRLALKIETVDYIIYHRSRRAAR